MTLRERFVNTASPSGGDGTTNSITGTNRAYSDLDGAENGETGSLVDVQLVIFCDGVADVSKTAWGFSWSLDASSSILVKPHANSTNTTGVLDKNKYHLATTTSGPAIDAALTGMVIFGIQFEVTATGSIGIRTAGANTVDSCIIAGVIGSTGRQGIIFEQDANIKNIINNVIYDMSSLAMRGTGTGSGTGGHNVYNNTVDGSLFGIVQGAPGGTNRVFNNIFTNNNTDYRDTGAATTGNNVTSDETSPDAGNDNKTITYADAANGDYSTSDSDIVGLGADLSADAEHSFDYDIKGDSRPGGAWDVGAFQAAASGASVTPNQNEAGDSASSSIKVIIGIDSVQSEPGDITSAAISAAESINLASNQAEAGDVQATSIKSIVRVASLQQESGDSAISALGVISLVLASQSESGDLAGAAINATASINLAASQNELGDLTSAAIQNVAALSASQVEDAGPSLASISNIVYINSNKLESGDLASADINVTASINLTAGQDDSGDALNATVSNVVSILTGQSEAGDATSASIALVARISCVQLDSGDSSLAAIDADTAANLSSSQFEDGDLAGATISNIIDILSNQNENGDTTSAAISAGARVAASGDIDILPAYSGQSGIIPAYLAKVSII